MVNKLGNEKEYKDASHTIIDMLVDATLKKHDVALDAKKIDDKTKEELRKLVKNLEESVQTFTKSTEQEE